MTLELSLVLERRQTILDIAYRHQIHSISIFGSVARGESHSGSDLDLLCEIDNLEEYYLFILYRICNEIITNAFIYSNSKKISMSLVKRYADISIGIEDNGIGFDGKISSWKGGLVKCFLTIDQLGGTMDIITAPGKGCMFIARIPYGVKYSDILDKINNGGGIS